MTRVVIRKIFHIIPVVRRNFYRQYNKMYFWVNNVQYGKGLQVYNKIYIKGEGRVKIGEDFIFYSGDALNPICRNVRGAIYTSTKEARVIIGSRVGISSACLWAKELIVIGNDVNIGANCIIIDNDAHPHDYLKRHKMWGNKVGHDSYMNSIPSKPIVIDDDVWVGACCTILKGVHIGARSIIAAGSVITKEIPSDVLAGGNPCKIIRKLV